MYRASGDGVLLYRTQGRCFSALDLGTDAAYLREEVLFGFEEGIAFENGRVPSSISAELNLVHLRGRGRFLLSTVGEPVAVDVAPQAPLKVPLAALVGWIGSLTPRVCALLDDLAHPAEVVVAVELAGIAMIPVFLWFTFHESRVDSFVAAVIYAVTGTTDFLDGWIARKKGLVTLIGKFLDPLADKLVVMAALVMLVHLGRVA